MVDRDNMPDPIEREREQEPIAHYAPPEPARQHAPAPTEDIDRLAKGPITSQAADETREHDPELVRRLNVAMRWVGIAAFQNVVDAKNGTGDTGTVTQTLPPAEHVEHKHKPFNGSIPIDLGTIAAPDKRYASLADVMTVKVTVVTYADLSGVARLDYSFKSPACRDLVMHSVATWQAIRDVINDNHLAVAMAELGGQ